MRKNWTRFIPDPSSGVLVVDRPIRRGRGRWLLALAFVTLLTGAVFVAKRKHAPPPTPELTPEVAAMFDEEGCLEEPKAVESGEEMKTSEATAPATEHTHTTQVEIALWTPVTPINPMTEVLRPTVAAATEPVRTRLIVSRGETLGEIAKREMGTGERLLEIACLNKIEIADLAKEVPAGTVVTLPADGETQKPSPPEPPGARVDPVAATAALPGGPTPEVELKWKPAETPTSPPPVGEAPEALHNEGSAPPSGEAPPRAPSPTPPPPVAAEPLGAPPTATPTPVVPSVVPPPAAPSPAPASPPMPPAAKAPPSVATPPPPAEKPRVLPVPLPHPPAAIAQHPMMPKASLPFTGTHPCSWDNDNRLTLPDAVVRQIDGGVLFVGVGPDKECLWLYTQDGLENLGNGTDKADGHRQRRLCYSRLEATSIDSSNHRIAFSEAMTTAGGLSGPVVLIGVRDHFELWDAERWRKYSEPQP